MSTVLKLFLTLFPVIAHAINLSPGSAEPGDSMTVTGSGFSGLASEITAYIGPMEATVTSATSTEIEIDLPNALSSGVVSILSNNGLIQQSRTSFQPQINEAGVLTSKTFAGDEPWTWPWEDPVEGPFSFNLSVVDDAGNAGPSQAVNVADLNRDGKADLIACNWNRGKLILYENIHTTGDLTIDSFTRIASYSVGSGPICSAVGDLNGDGWLDVVVVNSNARTISFLENTTTNSSSSPQLTLRGSLDIGSLVFGQGTIFIRDFDEDGLLDIIIGGGNISLIHATSTSHEISSENYTVTELVSYWEHSVTMTALSDLNGDNLPDIVAAGNSIKVFVNSTTANTPSLSLPLILDSEGASSSIVHVEDLNSDGKPDILAGNLVVFENTTDGNDLSFSTAIDVSSNYETLQIGASDISGDGLPDIWFVDRHTGVFAIQNSGTGNMSERFGGATSLGFQIGDAASGLYPHLQFADLNGDGRQDLVGDGLYNEIAISQNSVAPVELVSLVVSPSISSLTLPWYGNRNLYAYGIYSDGSRVDLTGSSTWSRTNTDITSGDNNAVIAESIGSSIIRADYNELYGTATVTISMIPEGNQLGYPDVNFAPKFRGGAAKSIAVQNDGAIIVGGSFDSVNGIPTPGLVRILPDGSVDTNFLTNVGIISESTSGGVEIVELDSLNRILIAGDITSVNGHTSKSIARLHSNGSIDNSFVSPIISGSVESLALMSEDEILVGSSGLSFYYGTPAERNSGQLIKLDSSGAIDSSFSPLRLYSGEVRAIDVDANGRVYVGGSFYDPDGLGLFALTRLTQTGELDSTFDTTVITNVVNALKIQPDGKIACVGSKSGEFVIRLHSDGSKDETFLMTDHPFWGVTEAVAVDSENRILLPYRFDINRLRIDGSLDSDFQVDTHSDFGILDMELTPWGDLWIAGGKSAVNGVGTMGICRIHLGDDTYEKWLSRQYAYGDRFSLDLAPDRILAGSQVSLLHHYVFGTGFAAENPLVVGAEQKTFQFSYDTEKADVDYEIYYSQTLLQNSWERIALKDASGDWVSENENFNFAIENSKVLKVEVINNELDTVFLKTSAILNQE